MKRAFLSYRRTDSDYALLLYEFLKQSFGRDQVFLDTDYIEPGENFVATLDRELESCAVFLALIGKGWIDSIERLGQPRDFVHREVAVALSRPGLVIPVLAGGARMPKAEDLPADMAALPDLSALEVRVHGDLDTLVRSIAKVLPPAPPPETAAPSPQQRRILDLLTRQVQRLQLRAVELLDANQPDRAFDELREGIEVLLCLQEWSPQEVSLTIQLGYIYKTLAQACLASNQPKEASRYFDLAASIFELAKTDSVQKQYSPADLAGALNGLGNIQYYRGDLDRAVENYRLAVTLLPGYAYAWHDLFGAYYERARRGQVDLAAMREALDQTRRTGQSIPGLSGQYLDQLEARLREFEPKVKKASKSTKR